MKNNPEPRIVSGPLKAISVAEGSRSAASAILDGSTCKLAALLAEWGNSEHGERSYERLLACIHESFLNRFWFGVLI